MPDKASHTTGPEKTPEHLRLVDPQEAVSSRETALRDVPKRHEIVEEIDDLWDNMPV